MLDELFSDTFLQLTGISPRHFRIYDRMWTSDLQRANPCLTSPHRRPLSTLHCPWNYCGTPLESWQSICEENYPVRRTPSSGTPAGLDRGRGGSGSLSAPPFWLSRWQGHTNETTRGETDECVGVSVEEQRVVGGLQPCLN